MNLSVAAADMYNGFDDITWIGDFEESIICDLDLSTLLVVRTAIVPQCWVIECRTSHVLSCDVISHISVFTLFNTPDYCVQEVTYAQITGNSQEELFQSLLSNHESTLQDNEFKIISGNQCCDPPSSQEVQTSPSIDLSVAGTCAQPHQPLYPGNPDYDYYCWFWFVKMATTLTSDTCLCTQTAGNCCTRELNPSITYL